MEPMNHSIRTTVTRSSLLALVAIAAACGNRDDATAPLSNGSLVLTLAARDGTTPSVTVTGPDGFSQTVSATTTLQHLAAGSYTITADSLVTPSTIVGYSVDTAAITGNPIVVTSSGSSAATVTYAFARQHGALWLAQLRRNARDRLRAKPAARIERGDGGRHDRRRAISRRSRPGCERRHVGIDGSRRLAADVNARAAQRVESHHRPHPFAREPGPQLSAGDGIR